MDANDDGRLTWDEFSSYVLQESMHLTSKGTSTTTISVFADSLPNDGYTDPSAYHTDMIHNIVAASVEVGSETFIKYITCGRDGTFRVWSSQTRRHIATVVASSRSPPAWVTCCTPLPNLATRTNVAGVVACFSLDKTMSVFDMKNFAKISEFRLGDDVFPLCCDAFSHTESVRGTVSKKNDIVVGDTQGRLHLYPQVPHSPHSPHSPQQIYTVPSFISHPLRVQQGACIGDSPVPACPLTVIVGREFVTGVAASRPVAQDDTLNGGSSPQ